MWYHTLPIKDSRAGIEPLETQILGAQLTLNKLLIRRRETHLTPKCTCTGIALHATPLPTGTRDHVEKVVLRLVYTSYYNLTNFVYSF